MCVHTCKCMYCYIGKREGSKKVGLFILKDVQTKIYCNKKQMGGWAGWVGLLPSIVIILFESSVNT